MIKTGLIKEIRSKISDLKNSKQWFYDALGVQEVHSGVSVTEQSAMRQTAVFACVRLLSEGLASLPLPVYKRLNPRGKEKATDHRLYKILHDKPNQFQTSFVFRSTATAHKLLYGNAYAEIERDNFAYPIALWPIPPWRCKPKWINEDKKRLAYEVTLTNGTTKTILSENMLHIKGLGTDGLVGLSPIRMAAEAIGVSIAAEEFGARFFGQGSHMGGVAEYPGELDEPKFNRLKKSLQEKYSGLGKSHRILLLEDGMKFQKVGIPPNEAQFIETRKFQIEEIARLYNVPLHLIQHHEKNTSWGSGIENMNLAYVIHTLRPYLVNWEQEIKDKLFEDKEKYFAEFVIEGLLRGDIQSRYEAYTKGRQWGFLSANDIRELENMNPLPGEQGDIYLSPMNMVNAEQLLNDEDLEPVRDLIPKNLENRGRKEKRNAESRRNIALSYRKVFEDAEKRILAREEADIMRAVKKILETGDVKAFRDWLEGFYQKHPEFIEKNMMAPVSSLAEAIQAEVAGEIGTEVGMTPELDKFIREYLGAYVIRHIEKSKVEIDKTLTKAFEEEEDEIEALQARFDHWSNVRPEIVARNESVKLSGAITRTVMALGGVRKLIWRNTGSDTCPFCEQLNGKTVGIDEPFIAPGEFIEADDGSEMKVYGPKMHAPIHRGCQCQIEAE